MIVWKLTFNYYWDEEMEDFACIQESLHRSLGGARTKLRDLVMALIPDDVPSSQYKTQVMFDGTIHGEIDVPAFDEHFTFSYTPMELEV
jgi:hypothetical protein